ncbi:multivesicular body subunit 12A [Anthonomus grandis grandis]|uniref:multivesicular body subunit 12A n=1 Tax=Anthonomus grandis grandis TaxID=2921223 RepID=UPI00216622AB|nr:multivesicular body subunit 12A [Anthonomus grandis grandis]
MLNSTIQNKILRTLPDDRPITAIQIVEDLDKCPTGFYPISRTYDQDQDADLGEKTFFKSTGRYLCLSKTEGIPSFVVQKIVFLNEKQLPPKGFSLLNKTADSQQRAWKKKQLCYQLANKKEIQLAITDIILCNKLKKAPLGFTLAGEINGVVVCYKMGNTESGIPDRPPKPLSPNTGGPVYPSLGEDDDYEILRPGYNINPSPGPIRPAPKPPAPGPPAHNNFQHQNSTHTLGNSCYPGLEGVPFIVNPKFLNSKDPMSQIPKIRIKTMQQILMEYDYSFTTERQVQ